MTDEAVEKTLQQLRERGAKFEPVEDRGVADGDTVVLDIERTDRRTAASPTATRTSASSSASAANPPGFDANLIGLRTGDEKTFTIHFPEDYAVKEMANTDVALHGDGQGRPAQGAARARRRVREGPGRVRVARRAARPRAGRPRSRNPTSTPRQHLRTDLLKQLSDRVTFDLPPSLVEREIDRRLEEFARQLMQQNVDPRQAGIDWAQFRESQREPARASVASALALDEIARREGLTVTAEEVDKEIERFAARAGRTPAALRAQLEKEGSVARLSTGLRREKAVDLVLSRARIL